METALRIAVIATLAFLSLKAYRKQKFALGHIAALMAANRLLLSINVTTLEVIMLYSGLVTIGIIWWALDGEKK